MIENDGFALGRLKDEDIDISQLVINEIMTSNRGAHIDEYGNMFDWIELFNGTDRDISLFNYGLSNRDSGEVRWVFPHVTIKSGEYLVVYLANITTDGLYANFNLNREGGELITLSSPTGKVIDAVRTIPLERNHVMSRSGRGEWIMTDEITPGFPNNAEGRQAYLATLFTDEEDDLIITEILPANRGNLIVDGSFPGFFEVQNKGTQDINLREYYISNSINAPFLWRLPDKVLEPGEVYHVWTSGLDEEGHARFRLNRRNGEAVLTRGHKIVEIIEYEDLRNGFAYKKVGNRFIQTSVISPGFVNTNEGISTFNRTNRQNPDGLMIAEVMNSNRRFMPHNGNRHYSWIALYNNGKETINLRDFTLTTDESSKEMFRLENKELRPGQFYFVMASGDTTLSTNQFKHANFTLGQTQSLYLYKDDIVQDAMFIADIPIGFSFGRSSNNGFYYFENPSPGRLNSNGRIGISAMPVASIAPGVFNDIDNLRVELSGGGQLFYTLDGSEPTRNSRVYNGPFSLSKTTVIRAISIEDGMQVSGIFTGSYIINENHTLPVLSISIPPNSFRTVLASGGSNVAYKSHAELFEDGELSFAIDCGLRLFGGAARWLPKRSFALRFSNQFGPRRLHHQVFENREARTYRTLTVRSGSQDAVYSMIRDELATGVMDDFGTVSVLAYKAVILYINGEYWGIYFIRENMGDHYVANNFNVSQEGVNIVRVDGVLSSGTSADYRYMVNFIRNNDMRNARNYEYAKTLLDIDNFIDFWIGQIYTTNNDIVNMRFFNHPNLDDGRIKMMFYDFDWAMYWHDSNHFNFMMRPSGLSALGYDNSIMRGLMQNTDFRKRFLDRMVWNMNNVWTDENVMNKFNELIALIEPEMPRNQARWNNTMKQWHDSTAYLENYITRRRTVILDHTRRFFNLSAAEMRDLFD